MYDYIYGIRLENEEIKQNRISYATLYKMINCVLCNDMANNYEFNEALYEAEYENNMEIIGAYDTEELLEECENYDIDITDYDTDDDHDVETLRDLLLERYNESYGEYYQYYITDEYGYDRIKEFSNDLVVYYEPLGVYVWCIGHYGTSWSIVYTSKPIFNKKEA